MTRQEATKILSLYRPDGVDAQDPSFKEALAEATRDPELQAWFESHCGRQRALRDGFRNLPAPDDLAAAILARHAEIHPKIVWWRQPVWWAAAALLVLSAIVATLWVSQPNPAGFDNFRARMVSFARRGYFMDITTNTHSQVREFLSSRGAPTNYVVSPALLKLPLSGGGALRWRNEPVSMVCFELAKDEMIFLFVMRRGTAHDPPPPSAQASQLNLKKMQTASWSDSDLIYLLAAPEKVGSLDQYVPL